MTSPNTRQNPPKEGPARTPTRACEAAWISAFLEAFRRVGTVTLAAREVGVGRSTVYEERGRNPEFAAALEDVDEEVGDQLEGTALELALGGNERLLQMLLRARRPGRYADRLPVEQILRIREEARRETIAELNADIAKLPAEARRIVMEAMGRVVARPALPAGAEQGGTGR